MDFNVLVGEGFDSLVALKGANKEDLDSRTETWPCGNAPCSGQSHTGTVWGGPLCVVPTTVAPSLAPSGRSIRGVTGPASASSGTAERDPAEA